MPSESLMVIEPVRAPVAVGVNVTEIEQFPPAATPPRQLLVSAKSPVAAMLANVNGTVLVFVSTIVCGWLVVPTVCTPKSKDEGASVTPVAAAVRRSVVGV